MPKQRTNSLMRDVHHLYPEAIYRFNASLHDVWHRHQLGKMKSDGGKEVYGIPVFFRKDTRTFSWIGAERHIWDWESNTHGHGALRDLVDDIEKWNSEDCGTALNERMAIRRIDPPYTPSERETAWKMFLEEQPNVGIYKKAKETILGLLKAGGTCDSEELHRALLALYSGYPQSVERNIEGVFYRFLRQCKKQKSQGRPDVLRGTLLDRGKQSTFEWLRITNPCKSCPSQGCMKETRYLRDSQPATRALYGRHRPAPAQFLAEELFLDRLLLQVNRHPSFGHALKDRREIALIPLHDFQFADTGYGGIRALFIVFFRKKAQRAIWLRTKSKLPSFLKSFAELSDGLATSATVFAASLPIRPPYDLLSHFLEALIYLQDWESATVIDHDNARYQYKRSNIRNDASSKYGWNRQSCARFANILTSVTECIEMTSSGKNFVWWTNGNGNTPNLWSEDFLPGIDNEVIARFQRYSIRFEFPAATHLPAGDDDRRRLRDAYIRQQLDLMRVLIPKVRARRAALRSVVSAIMGRNMSHNIGSHVIARYASEVHEDRLETRKDKSDHRRDFLSYLQRRMDFLAEVATSDQSYWEQPLSLLEALTKLNYHTQCERMGTYAECQLKDAKCPTHLGKPGAPILLSFITGKGNKGTVLPGKPSAAGSVKAADATLSGDAMKDLFFSCPSGDVGVHALYVILENIIRNSARHVSSTGGDVGLYVFFNLRKADQLIELTIVDPRTYVLQYPKSIDAEGYALDEVGRRSSAASPEVDSEGYVLNTNGMRSSAGTRILCHHINRIINQEPLLTAAGDANPQYWGLREMHICAQYLRGLSFRDLEGGIADGEPPVLKAVEYKLPDGKHCLSYQVFLKPAKRLAYVVTHTSAADEGVSKVHSVDSIADPDLAQLGIKPIEVAAGIDWRHVAAEARGFEFLSLDPELHRTLYEQLKRTAPAPTIATVGLLPVRVVFLGRGELAEVLDKARGGASDWADALHGHVMDGYRTRDTEKKAKWCGDIKVFAAWDDDGKGHLPVPVIRNDHLSCYHVVGGGGDCKPFASGTLHDLVGSSVGVAWVDHADDGLMNPIRQLKDKTWVPDGSMLQSAYLPVEKPDFNWVSAEPVFNHSVHCASLKKARDAKSLTGMQELVAAAFARVVVLDERVQDCRTKKVRNATLGKCWPQAGIWCPLQDEDFDSTIPSIDPFHDRKVCSDLNHPDFDRIHGFLCNPTKLTYQCPADFLVIHLTILESLNKQRPTETLNDTLRALVAKTSCETAEKIIVTGRGVPAGQVHLACRYLPISALLDYLVMHPSKLGLMRVLWAATARTSSG